jgi:hypothetical protein
MCGFFEQSVNGTLELIDGQIKQIHKNEFKKPKVSCGDSLERSSNAFAHLWGRWCLSSEASEEMNISSVGFENTATL